MRKLLLLACTFLLAASITALASRSRWPGAHPHAVRTSGQRWQEREAQWAQMRLPHDAPDASTLNDVMRSVLSACKINSYLVDVSYADMKGVPWRGLDPPVPLSGRPAGEALQEAIEQAGIAGKVAFVWTDSGLLMTKPEAAPDINIAMCDISAIRARWWSPRLLWSRATTPQGQAPKDDLALIWDRLTRDIDPESWNRSNGDGGGVIALTGGALQINNSNANVAAAEDLLWRIKLEALLFDSAVVGLTIALLVGTGLLMFARVRDYRRKRQGKCRGCGYDLRESPERCPECGRPVSTLASAVELT